jgi:hypothetical protein
MGYEGDVVIHHNTAKAPAAFHKIVCFLPYIHYHGDNRKQKNRKEKSSEEFFNDIPI